MLLSDNKIFVRVIILVVLAFAFSVFCFHDSVREFLTLRLPLTESVDGPASKGQTQAWLDSLKESRDWIRKRVDTQTGYDRKELLWTQTNFVQTLLMVEDERFYDRKARKYTVDAYLDDVEKRFGGIDSVLLWQAYPNIGIDDRNQFDWFKDMPGGLSALKKAVDDFHRRGVKVFIPSLPWDVSTHYEDTNLPKQIVEEAKQLNVDGINGDTMLGVPRDYQLASEAAGYPLALESERAFAQIGMINWNNMSWGYWNENKTPVLNRYKWIQPEHMVHVSARWHQDRTKDLQDVLFNGSGFVVWENIFGIWNAMPERNKAALKRIHALEKALTEILIAREWVPFVETVQDDVYASEFPGKEATAWMFVSNSEIPKMGHQLEISSSAGERWFDVWHGQELKPKTENGKTFIDFAIEPHGYGAILRIPDGNYKFNSLLEEMASLNQPPASYSLTGAPALQHMVYPEDKCFGKSESMQLISGGAYNFEVHGVEIEGGNGPGVDVQYPWETVPSRYHNKIMKVPSFYMDRFPVTNEQFKQFLESSHYVPQDSHNFLRQWRNGTYPNGYARKPVVWVSLEDARAYATWANKRLPHEWEWQLAAQGLAKRSYPWGNAVVPQARPVEQNQGAMRPPDDVDAHPSGKSQAGVMDLTGNVWQWTDEYDDGHTRFAIIRGGSFYQPNGSVWYFPPNKYLNEHGKYLLMDSTRDRSAAVGFRCVADSQEK